MLPSGRMERPIAHELTLAIALGLFAASVWLHLPYGGGHVYSDIVSVFQVR